MGDVARADTVRAAHGSGAPAAKNNVTLGSSLVRNFAGTDLGYRRHLGWRLSAGAAVEYLYPHGGFEYLQGVGERVELSIWPSKVFNGPFFSAEFTAAQQFLAPDPSVRSVAIGGGGQLGWNWMLGWGLNVGVSAGVRRSKVVSESSLICSREAECPFIRDVFMPRFALHISYAF